MNEGGHKLIDGCYIIVAFSDNTFPYTSARRFLSSDDHDHENIFPLMKATYSALEDKHDKRIADLLMERIVLERVNRQRGGKESNITQEEFKDYDAVGEAYLHSVEEAQLEDKEAEALAQQDMEKAVKSSLSDFELDEEQAQIKANQEEFEKEARLKSLSSQEDDIDLTIEEPEEEEEKEE